MPVKNAVKWVTTVGL